MRATSSFGAKSGRAVGREETVVASPCICADEQPPRSSLPSGRVALARRRSRDSLCPQEAKKLPWDERLQHKNWKVRNDANIDLAALCDSITDPKDTRLREFGPLFKKTVADPNTPVQEKALVGLLAFQRAADADAARYAKEVCDAIVAKCLTGRPKTAKKAQAAFLVWVELEVAEVFLKMKADMEDSGSKMEYPTPEKPESRRKGIVISSLARNLLTERYKDIFADQPLGDDDETCNEDDSDSISPGGSQSLVSGSIDMFDTFPKDQQTNFLRNTRIC